MGIFKRTNRGLSNLHLFHNVDYIVYLEGGSLSFTKEEVFQNKFSSDTEDISFWTQIFKKYTKNQKLKFKSIGSKKTLKDIAEDLYQGKINNIYIAMDNEFDEILGKRLIHKNIFYTNGYSYENDVWSADVIIEILKDLTATQIDEIYIKRGFNNFKKEIRDSVFADSYLFKKGESFFPRKQGHLFCIQCNSEYFPNVKSEEIEKVMIAKGIKLSTVRSYAYKNKVNVTKFCFGHLYADFCCQIINHYIKIRHKFATIRKEILYRMAIRKFFQTQFKNSLYEIHYMEQFK